MKLTDLQRLATIARAVFPQSVIAGGAPRDAFFGRPIKDVDLFVQCEPAMFMANVQGLAAALGGSVLSNPSQASLDVPSADIVLPDGQPPINVILRDVCVFDDIHDYDFGISQIAVTPHGILKTPAFELDCRNQTITYMHRDVVKADWHVASSAKRMARLRAKYPDFMFQWVDKLMPLLPE